MSIFKTLFRSRDKPVTNTLFGSAYSFFFGGTTSGKTVNERTAMQTTAVYACVRILVLLAKLICSGLDKIICRKKSCHNCLAIKLQV